MDALDNEIVYKGCTRKQLHDAFSKVQNAENWKLPIDVKIPASNDMLKDVDNLRIIRLGIAFFTGSNAHISKHDGYWHVRAVGYYAAVGA